MRRISRRRSRRGQSLVEFAVVFPVFMIMLGGVVQFGMIFWGQNTINQIVRDGGRYAATVTECDGSASADVIAKTNALAAGTILSSFSVATPVWTPTGPCPDTNAVGQAVWVRLSASARVPIFFPLVPDDFAVRSEAEFRMEPVLQ